MKVLVTGGAGFLGSHVCEYYRSRGDQVVAYDNLTKHELSRTGYDAEGARDYMVNFLMDIGVVLVKADVRDLEVLLDKAKGCDYIVHCAAQPAMTIALEKPGFDASVNVVGAINVLEVARQMNIPIVNCSTIHIYGSGINRTLVDRKSTLLSHLGAISETQPILTGQLTPLHASKRAAEIYTQTYADSYGVNAATFRLTGIFGSRQFGGEDHGWVANFAIRTILGLPIRVMDAQVSGKAVNGRKQVRDIIYVTDAVDAIAKYYDNGGTPGIYNICGGFDTVTSLGDCLDILTDISGKKQKIEAAPTRLGDLYYFVGSYAKAKRSFGWEPKWDVEDGLKELVVWVQENISLFEGR